MTGRFCQQCGTPAQAPDSVGAAEPPAGDNTRAAMAYFILPAVFYLLDDRFKSNRILRFHAYQALLLLAAVVVGYWFLWAILSFVFGFFTLILGWLFTLASFVLWAKTAMGAYSGRAAKIPVLGDIAEKQVS